MKKQFLLISFFALLALVSCKKDSASTAEVDADAIALSESPIPLETFVKMIDKDYTKEVFTGKFEKAKFFVSDQNNDTIFYQRDGEVNEADTETYGIKIGNYSSLAYELYSYSNKTGNFSDDFLQEQFLYFLDNHTNLAPDKTAMFVINGKTYMSSSSTYYSKVKSLIDNSYFSKTILFYCGDYMLLYLPYSSGVSGISYYYNPKE